MESMRALMNDTFNRFKVVFAGLHNVQRFAGRPNSPFSNLGFNPNRPRRGGIGPLSDHEARQLVEEPCSLLGFRFEQLAVDKILSYTNRHPSLIQFFCHELIQTWRAYHLDGRPPFHVGIADVDKVYRKKSIQEGIRRRFEETFKLDPRYHVISLTMIYFQERPTQKWTLEELRECCQCCWSFTFHPDNLEDLKQSQSGIYIDTGLDSAANTVIPANAGIQGTWQNVLSWTPAYAGATRDFALSGCAN